MIIPVSQWRRCKKVYAKNPFTTVENDDGSWVRYLTDVKSALFRPHLVPSRVSSHIEEMGYNETVCLRTTIYMLPQWVEHTKGEFAGQIWNIIALLKNWALQAADNLYVKSIRNNSFKNAENDDGSGVRYTTEAKSAGFWIKASCLSWLTEELW